MGWPGNSRAKLQINYKKTTKLNRKAKKYMPKQGRLNRNLQRGAAAEGRPPFVGLLSHKLFRLVLKSRICSLTADSIFQFFVGEAWGERRIMFWTLKGHHSSVFSYYLRSLAWKGYPSTLRFIATQGASDLVTTTLSSRPYCIFHRYLTL